MKLSSTLLSLTYLLTFQPVQVYATPLFDKDEPESHWEWIGHLFGRQAACAGTPCGLDNRYCCTGGSVCYTDAATIARCAAATAIPQGEATWQFYTTTYVLTNLVTVTSTFSSLMGGVAPTVAASAMVCGANQNPCGAVCCDPSIETCYALGKCTPWAAIPAATTYSAPLRGTSGIPTTITAVVTATQPFQAPATAGTNLPLTTTSNSLSSGAIAGIVIGTIGGVIILVLLCFFCVLRASFNGLLGLFGLGPSRRRTSSRTEIIEERYSRRGNATGASGRERHAGWFGGGGGSGRQTSSVKKGRSGLAKEGGILAAIAVGLAGLWALLGFRRRTAAKSSRSDVSYETYTDSYSGTISSDNSRSSAGRTRMTRDTRGTRDSRRTRDTRTR